jgi:ABC-type glycerol-3-phosphate transport system substrate-binding protein
MAALSCSAPSGPPVLTGAADRTTVRPDRARTPGSAGLSARLGATTRDLRREGVIDTMSRLGYRTGHGPASRGVGLVLAAALCLTAGACSDSGDEKTAGGKVKVTVNGQPPRAQVFERQVYDQDVAEFEASHPNIDLVPREGFMDPKTFAAKLAGGQLEDVFYVYFTDPAQIIARRQAADITDYVKDLEHAGDLQEPLLEVFSRDGRRYGLPTANYSMGLLYNRALFTRAGLDPDRPPRTWDEVRVAAKKISGLGNGIVGYADYSKNNQGGWHLTSWMYSVGGAVARKDGDRWKADLAGDKGRQVLGYLHDMRWTDNSMGSRQLLQIEDVQRMMGGGKLGMYLAAPDNVPTLVKQFEGRYADYGLAPMPGGQGTLIGGEGYMVNAKASPEKIRAGLAWIEWKYLNPDRFEKNIRRFVDAKLPVGLATPPTPDIWTGAVRERQEQLKGKYANVPLQNYRTFLAAAPTLKGNIEPPNAQQIYAVLDGVMQAVLTDRNADRDKLLADAQKKVDGILAQVK